MHLVIKIFVIEYADIITRLTCGCMTIRHIHEIFDEMPASLTSYMKQPAHKAIVVGS